LTDDDFDESDLNSGDRVTLSAEQLRKRLKRARERAKDEVQRQVDAQRAREQAEREQTERVAQEQRQQEERQFEELATTRGQRVKELESQVQQLQAQIDGYQPLVTTLNEIADREFRALPKDLREAIDPLLEGKSPVERMQWLNANRTRLTKLAGATTTAEPATDSNGQAASTTASSETAASQGSPATGNATTAGKGAAGSPATTTTTVATPAHNIPATPPVPAGVTARSQQEVEAARTSFGRSIRQGL
jgi:hypothetical protein